MRFLCILLLRASLSCLGEGAQTPVVGILSEPAKDNTTECMIAASYVKWLELGGARSIPIPYDATASDVENIFPHINGVLFPGGIGKRLPPAARHIWHLAGLENSEEGHGFFPIFGTCLGFEYLLILASGDDNILEGGFDAENISLPLQVQEDSRLYQGAIKAVVEQLNITLNNHHFGISPKKFSRSSGLTSLFHATSVNQDRQGKPFVSTIEPKDPESTPYYGVQYHPEKNAFEYGTHPGTNLPYEAIDHSPEGILLTAHLARFFVNLTATNLHRRSEDAFVKTFPPVYSYPRRVGIEFQEYYIIPNSNEMAARTEQASQAY